MKVKAGDIRTGDRILAYCNQGRQTCTVRKVLELENENIVLTVSTPKHNRNSISKVIRFSRDALIDLAT
jgi:hypothetical protein